MRRLLAVAAVVAMLGVTGNSADAGLRISVGHGGYGGGYSSYSPHRSRSYGIGHGSYGVGHGSYGYGGGAVHNTSYYSGGHGYSGGYSNYTPSHNSYYNTGGHGNSYGGHGSYGGWGH